MEHGENLDDLGVPSIHDAIRRTDEFSKVRLLTLGHHPARVGKGAKLINGRIQSLDNQLCVRGGVSPNEVADRDEVVGSLLSPANLGHSPRRRRTSSWLMVLPASAC